MAVRAASSSGGGGGSGTVTDVSVVTANGFAGTVADSTTTPAITLTTTITGTLFGNGTAISASKLALTQPATGSTLTIIDGKTLTANHSLTLAGTDSTTMTFPSTSATIARTDAGQTFTGTNVFGVMQGTSLALGGATIGSNALAVTGTSLLGGVATVTGGVNIDSSGGFSTLNLRDSSSNRANFFWDQSNNRAVIGTVNANASLLITTSNSQTRWTFGSAGGLSNTSITLGDQAQVLAITATQPASPTGAQDAVLYSITSAGSASQFNRAFSVVYNAGYTGSSVTAAGRFGNLAAGTGSTLIPAAGSNSAIANYGFFGFTSVTTAGANVGAFGSGDGGNLSVGVLGLSQVAKNSATNIGVVGSAINTGSSPVMVGVWASLNQTTVPTVSAALIADNGAQTSPILLLRDNASTVFSVIDGGTVGVGTAATTTSQMSFLAGTTAKSQMNFAASTAPTSPVDGDFWFDGTDFKARVSGVTKTFTLT